MEGLQEFCLTKPVGNQVLMKHHPDQGTKYDWKCCSLVIIDGVPGRMNDVNSADIEDISVLKDAAAAAPYGLAAANGVI